MSGFLTYLGDFTQSYITNSPRQAALLTVALLPFGAITLNVVWQLLPGDPSHPPEVFHVVPFIGSAIPYGKDPLGFFLRCREKYGNVFTFTVFGRKITVALGAKGNNFILGGKHASFSADEAYKYFSTPVFGKGVVYDVPEENFMDQKKFVKVGLSLDNFRLYVGMIEDEVECFLKKDLGFLSYQMNDVKKWGHFDAKHVMDQITILTTSRTLQGPEVRENLDKSFSKLLDALDGGFTPLHFFFPHLPLESHRVCDEAQKKMSEFYINIIQKRRQLGEDAQDMISALMSQRYRDGKSLPDHVTAHLMVAILFAGRLTSSAAGCWTLLRLAQNPNVQEALYQEQVQHFREANGTFRSMTYEQLRDLPVLDSIIRETLRLHPPLHNVMRYVTEDVPVPAALAAPSKDGAYVIPRGHYVIACILLVQVDPEAWNNSHSWDPTRWSDPEGFAAQASQAYSGQRGEQVDYEFGLVSKSSDSPYTPFGAGRHRCIGEQFAYLQIGTVIAMLVRHLEFKLDQPFPEEDYQSMVTLPKKPRNISYMRRNVDA